MSGACCGYCERAWADEFSCAACGIPLCAGCAREEDDGIDRCPTCQAVWLDAQDEGDDRRADDERIERP